MGIQLSYLKNLLVHQSLTGQCLPLTPYVKFPKERWTFKEDDQLLMDIHVYPERLHRARDPGEWFWWCDAEFTPFNDSSIYATASVFQPRPTTRRWIPLPSMPNGRVLQYEMPTTGNISCHIFSRTNCSVYPKVQPHPLGELVGYCGTGEVVIMGSTGDPVFHRSRDLANAIHLYCAIANNGISFACVKRGLGVFYLETYLLQTTMSPDKFVRCHEVCPGFVPSKNVSDCVRCKFSPDCKLIAVSSSTGFLFTVTKNNLLHQCNVCPDILGKSLSGAGAFDFHPCYPSQILTVGTSDQSICILNLVTTEILDTIIVEELVDCIRYSPDGKRFAVAFHNFDIHLFNSDTLSCVQTMMMSKICVDDVRRTQYQFQAVLNLSFSQNGEQLVSSSCDGHIRLWHTPRTFSLQELCRDTILSYVAIREVKQLAIPTKVKDFLTYKFF